MKKNIVIVILLLAVIGCAGYIGYDKLYLERQDQQENKEETNQPEETQTEEINTDSTFVEDLVGRYDYYFISDTNLENMLYTNDTTTPTELTEDFIKQTATYAYYAIPRGLSGTWQQTYNFTSDDLKEQVRKLYGPEVTITDSSFDMDCGTYEYNAENNTYTRNEGSGCGGTNSTYLTREVVSATKEENQIMIEVAVARVDVGNNIILNMNDEAIEELTAENFDISTALEQVDHFIYQFNYDEENHNYYLATISKVN